MKEAHKMHSLIASLCIFEHNMLRFTHRNNSWNLSKT